MVDHFDCSLGLLSCADPEGRTGGPDPKVVPNPGKSQAVCLSRNPGKSQSYPASIQCWAINGPAAKRSDDGPLLTAY